MRAFVAVPLGPSPAPGGSPGPVEHLTLHFLGEVPETTVRAVAERLEPVVRAHAAFPIRIEGVSAFPSRERPRVVWREVTEGRGPLVRLAEDVRRADGLAGAPAEDRPFVPHLTWFRVGGPGDARRAREVLDGRAPAPAPRRAEVVEVALLESRLAPTGVQHRTLRRFPLGPPGD